ncbi:unnamed protein product [Arabidopsis thaliana]|uniref:DUF4408 domain-containing protein n=3 Tax=Arabidopsis thaliana TaxID=3702 RepID=A0A654E9Y7_ARATH|nr:cotton fiber, putative (DUF761) [Arabidopsis thaliana]AEE28700.1 cotton fiber, putative (DUF761) [Arabidopsis thaliana]VYS45715.1 unnamed protein product [Arabidopsis thaliana]|eukprot:NP_172588.1 cotton fiber, putative (DUF761) [Arabidopsis thaliana]
MVSSMISIKAALITAGIVAVSLFLKSSVPIAVDFSVSRFPIFWSSFLSWLKPPYLFVAINVIITIIMASSKFYQSVGEQDGEDDEILLGGEYTIPNVITQAPPRRLVDLDADFDFVATVQSPILVAEVEILEVVFEEKEMAISGQTNGGDEFAVMRSELNQPIMEESENLPPAEKPLVSARSGHRKPIKASSKGVNRKKKALKVVKPNRHETLENTWNMITEEGKSTPLTCHYRKTSMSGLNAGGDVKPVLRKAETFRDVTNYRQSSPTVTSPVKMKKEMSPSREELNRRVEAFIKKCKEERLESLKLEK